MQLKSPIVGILFLGLLGGLLIGCTPPPPSTSAPPQPFAGKTIRVACPGQTSAEVVEIYSRAWCSQEGAAIEVCRFNLAASPEQAGPADVWILPPAALPRYAAAGLLLPVPRDLTAPESPFGWADLLPLFRERLVVWDGTACALPLLGEAPVLLYRSDRFAQAEHQAAFQQKYQRKLALPATWEEFADLAEYFRDAGEGGNKHSLPPLAADDTGLDREFFSVAACAARRALSEEEQPRDDRADQLFSFQYDHRTGQSRLDAPGFAHALALLKRLQSCRPPDASAAPVEAFRDGKAVFCLTDIGQIAALQRKPELRDKFGICKIPGGGRYFDYATGAAVVTPEGNRVPYLGAGGWLATVPKQAAEPAAAWALLANLAGRERSAQIVIDSRWGGGATRRDHFDRVRWDAFDLDPERTKELKEAMRQTLLHASVLNPAVRLRTPDEAAHTSALLAEVRSTLKKDGVDPAPALAAAKKQWEALDRTQGATTTLANYRLSVGLLPKQ